MLTYTGLRTQYEDLTNSGSTNHLDRGSRVMNQVYRKLCGSQDWPFLQRERNIGTTTASTQDYDLPSDYDKAVNVVVTSGTTKYVLAEISSWKEWELLNQTPSFTSSFPVYYFIQNNGNQSNKQVGIWPTPSTTGDTITVTYRKRIKDLSLADYTTGAITTATNGDATIVGSGTTWTAKMVGSYIQIADSYSADTGDGVWYEIESITSTTELELATTYDGDSISGGSASYTIGQVPLIPENYQHIIPYYAAYLYWNVQGNNAGRADRFKQEYVDLMQELINDQLSKADDVVVEPVINDFLYNPNLFVEI